MHGAAGERTAFGTRVVVDGAEGDNVDGLKTHLGARTHRA